jgi:type IV pilus assembly protein PilF
VSTARLRACVLALIAACQLAACAAPDSSGDSGPVIGEVGAPRDRARAHTELAAAYLEGGNLGVALEEARLALKADSGYAPAYNIMGLVQMDLRDSPEAERAFERALRINPDDPDTNHNYGWFLCKSGREEESVRYFMNAVRNPLYGRPQKTYALAASCVLQKKNEKDALEFYDRSLRLDPRYAPALIGLAQLRYRRGELRDARTLVGRYNKVAEPTAESLWLGLRIERKLGDRIAEGSYATQLRRRFAGSREYQELQKGRYE